MTQSLSSLLNAPLLLVALLLWLLLAFLLILELKRRNAQKKSKLILQKNHPAIPTRKYHLSEFESGTERVAVPKKPFQKEPLSAEEHARRLSGLGQSWDIG